MLRITEDEVKKFVFFAHCECHDEVDSQYIWNSVDGRRLEWLSERIRRNAAEINIDKAN